MENNTNNESFLRKTSTNNDVNNSKKKTKKFNGFLRNNQKKSTNKKINKSHNNFHPENLESEENLTHQELPQENKSYIKESQEEYEIFTSLRQKTGFNESKFWENLSIVLNKKSFNDLRRSDLSIISYAVLHESDRIFEKLLLSFGKEINNEEYVNYVFKYGIHKNPKIIDIALNFYEKNFIIENNFLVQFIKDIAHISYRSENNDIFLNWLEPKMNDDLLNLFWTECFNNNNIPLLQKSINHTFFSQYLQKNKNLFQTFIDNSGRKFEINQSLNNQKNTKKITQKVENNNESAKINSANNLITENFEPKIWLSDKTEQFKVIEENLSDKKPTEVIIKRKRKIA